MQHSFGDKGDNIILLVDHKDKLDLKEIPTDVEKKKTIYSNIEDIAQVIEKGVKSTESEKIKVAIKGTSEEFKVFKESKEYKQLVKSGVTIAFKQEARQKPELGPDDTSENTDFHDILNNLLEKTQNATVLQDYKEVFYG